MSSISEKAVKVQETGRHAGNAVWELLLKRCEEFKLVCTRLNSMPKNKHIANRVERHTIGVIAALAILNPLFWIFGIKGIVISLDVLEKVALGAKFVLTFALTVARKTVKGVIVLAIVLALSVQEVIKIVRDNPLIFILLGFFLIYCLSQEPVPTF